MFSWIRKWQGRGPGIVMGGAISRLIGGLGGAIGRPMSRLTGGVMVIPIHCYRLLISPWLGTQCRFQPSCSAYALDAIRLHGPLKGGYLSARRIARCRPGGGAGFDPVPSAMADKPAAPSPQADK